MGGKVEKKKKKKSKDCNECKRPYGDLRETCKWFKLMILWKILTETKVVSLSLLIGNHLIYAL